MTHFTRLQTVIELKLCGLGVSRSYRQTLYSSNSILASQYIMEKRKKKGKVACYRHLLALWYADLSDSTKFLRNGEYKEFTLGVFVSLMLHEEGTQLLLFRLGPDCSWNFLVSRFSAVAIRDFCRVTAGLPEEQLHVRLPVFLGDFGEMADYEDRELLQLLKAGIDFSLLDESTSASHQGRYMDAIKTRWRGFIARA